MNNTQKRQETPYNKLIGRIGDEYYFLDYTFEHSDNFKGATGSVLTPLTEEECQERNDQASEDSEMVEFWKQAVEADRTTDSFQDWLEMVKEEEGEEAGLDDSYRAEYMPILQELLGEDEVYTTDCTGGGRCFNPKMEWDELYNPELWEIIKKAETE